LNWLEQLLAFVAIAGGLTVFLVWLVERLIEALDRV